MIMFYYLFSRSNNIIIDLDHFGSRVVKYCCILTFDEVVIQRFREQDVLAV